MMVSAAGAGRACPYCRFALKEGMLVEQCDSCHALHHEDCWADNRGCAVVGCGAQATVVASPTEAGPRTAEASPPPPPPTGAAGGRPDRNGRGMFIGIACGLLIAAAGVGGYVLATGGDDANPSSASATRAAATTTPAATPTEDVTETAPSEPTRDEIESTVVSEIQDIIEFSRRGRTAVQEGRYEAAIRNRERVLARLDALETAPGRLGRAQRKLRQAMKASLASDRNYAAQIDASGFDALATQRKHEFVELWNPVAARHSATTYTDGEF
jgi:hypothetical protein